MVYGAFVTPYAKLPYQQGYWDSQGSGGDARRTSYTLPPNCRCLFISATSNTRLAKSCEPRSITLRAVVCTKLVPELVAPYARLLGIASAMHEQLSRVILIEEGEKDMEQFGRFALTIGVAALLLGCQSVQSSITPNNAGMSTLNRTQAPLEPGKIVVALSNQSTVVTFPANGNGNIRPTSVLSGPKTDLLYPGGLYAGADGSFM